MRRKAIAAATTAGVILAGGLFVAPTADAAGHLNCTASASPKHPADESTVRISVHTKADAKVHTVAKYKSTNTPHSGTANSHGNVVIAYKISRATPGFKVHVSVTVSTAHKSGTCSTSFTPR
jgi:hypothetical protein